MSSALTPSTSNLAVVWDVIDGALDWEPLGCTDAGQPPEKTNIGIVVVVQGAPATVTCPEILEAYGCNAVVSQCTVKDCCLKDGDMIAFTPQVVGGSPFVTAPCWRRRSPPIPDSTCHSGSRSTVDIGEHDRWTEEEQTGDSNTKGDSSDDSQIVYVGIVTDASVEVGFSTAVCPKSGCQADIKIDPSVAKPSLLEKHDVVAFKIKDVNSDYPTAVGPLWKLYGWNGKDSPKLGDFVGFVRKSPSGELAVDCSDAEAVHGQKLHLSPKIVSFCGLCAGHTIAFCVEVGAEGSPQVVAPCWKCCTESTAVPSSSSTAEEPIPKTVIPPNVSKPVPHTVPDLGQKPPARLLHQVVRPNRPPEPNAAKIPVEAKLSDERAFARKYPQAVPPPVDSWAVDVDPITSTAADPATENDSTTPARFAGANPTKQTEVVTKLRPKAGLPVAKPKSVPGSDSVAWAAAGKRPGSAKGLSIPPRKKPVAPKHPPPEPKSVPRSDSVAWAAAEKRPVLAKGFSIPPLRKPVAPKHPPPGFLFDSKVDPGSGLPATSKQPSKNARSFRVNRSDIADAAVDAAAAPASITTQCPGAKMTKTPEAFFLSPPTPAEVADVVCVARPAAHSKPALIVASKRAATAAAKAAATAAAAAVNKAWVREVQGCEGHKEMKPTEKMVPAPPDVSTPRATSDPGITVHKPDPKPVQQEAKTNVKQAQPAAIVEQHSLRSLPIPVHNARAKRMSKKDSHRIEGSCIVVPDETASGNGCAKGKSFPSEVSNPINTSPKIDSRTEPDNLPARTSLASDDFNRSAADGAKKVKGPDTNNDHAEEKFDKLMVRDGLPCIKRGDITMGVVKMSDEVLGVSTIACPCLHSSEDVRVSRKLVDPEILAPNDVVAFSFSADSRGHRSPCPPFWKLMVPPMATNAGGPPKIPGEFAEFLGKIETAISKTVARVRTFALDSNRKAAVQISEKVMDQCLLNFGDIIAFALDQSPGRRLDVDGPVWRCCTAPRIGNEAEGFIQKATDETKEVSETKAKAAKMSIMQRSSSGEPPPVKRVKTSASK